MNAKKDTFVKLVIGAVERNLNDLSEQSEIDLLRMCDWSIAKAPLHRGYGYNWVHLINPFLEDVLWEIKSAFIDDISIH